MEENKNPVNVPPPAPFPGTPNGGQSSVPPPPPVPTPAPTPAPVPTPTPIPTPPPTPTPVPPPTPVPAPAPTPVPPPPPMPTPPPMRPIQPSFTPTPTSGSVPPPPPPEIGIRTMDSDMKSMQSSGGTGVAPQTFKPEELFSKPIGSGTPQSSPLTSSATPSPVGIPTVTVIGPKKSNKKVIILAGVVVLLLAIWAVVQFLIVPALHSSHATPTVPAVVTTPAQVIAPSAPIAIVHRSFFTATTSTSTTVSLNSPVSVSSLQEGIASSTSVTEPTGTFEDISFVNVMPNGPTTVSGPWTAQALLGTALPSSSSTVLSNLFNQDVTGFAYYNASGIWPGYVFELNSAGSLATASSTIDPLIEANAANFFQVQPGTSSGAFTNGSLPDGKAVRYLAFSKKGATLEYGWIGNYLVISTSYQGMVEADQHL